MADVEKCISRLQALREGSFYDENTDVCIWFDSIESLCSQLGVSECMPRMAKRQIHRNSTPASTPKEYYIRNLAIPFLENLVAYMRERFDGKNQKLLALFMLVPEAISKLKSSQEGELHVHQRQYII